MAPPPETSPTARGSEPSGGPRALDRRSFLRSAGATAAAAGAAVLLGPLAAGCGGPGPSGGGSGGGGSGGGAGTTTPTTGGTGRTGQPSPADWQALAASLGGSLVLPADPAYAVDAQLYNERFDGATHPAGIAYCASSQDVQRCVDFVRRHGIRPAIRSGGHSFGGYSSGNGLVVDVTRMASVTVAPDRTTATIGAGARLVDVYTQLGAAGVILPGGSCPTVGIAGLTLGGGVGVVGRNYGLTSDRLTALRIVTADGSIVTADATSHTDLFWACRGGGGGNFGVATSFTFDVAPVPPLALFTLAWPWSAAPEVLGSWLHWVPATPPPLWSNCQLLSQGTAGGSTPLLVKVTGVYCGGVPTLTALVGRLVASVGSTPSYRYVGSQPYLTAMLIEAGCEGKSVAQCHLPTQDPAGTLSRAASAAKSLYLTAPLPTAGIAALVGAVEALDAQVPSVGGGCVLDSYGGAIGRLRPTETAFVHRDALACIQSSFSWSAGTTPSVVAAGNSWLATTGAALAPYGSGAYVNYIDPTLGTWATAYYGANLARLSSVKAAVDPDDLFEFAQGVPAPAPS